LKLGRKSPVPKIRSNRGGSHRGGRGHEVVRRKGMVRK